MTLFDDTREDWNARSPRHVLDRVDPRTRTEFMVHYDGADHVVAPLHSDCLARVLQDQRYHQDSNGWADIGYTGLVCQHGRAIEGRGADVAGAHCPDHNVVAYGWQFMVGGDQQPTAAALVRMARVYADSCARSGRGLRRLVHLDGFATACPGPFITRWVRAGMPVPTTTTTTQGEDDMSEKDVEDIKDYVGRLLVKGYTVDGKAFPGIAAVNIENQRRITATGEAVAGVSAKVAALSAAVQQLAAGKPLDFAAIEAAARAGAADAIRAITVTVEGAE